MMHFITHYLWHSLVGWVGITGCVLAGAVVAFIYLPPAAVRLRHICVGVASLCLGVLFLYPKAFLDGENHVKAEVLAQEQKLRRAGETARADSIAAVARGVRDPWDSDAK